MEAEEHPSSEGLAKENDSIVLRQKGTALGFRASALGSLGFRDLRGSRLISGSDLAQVKGSCPAKGLRESV